MVKPRALSVAGLAALTSTHAAVLGILGIFASAGASADPARATENHPVPMQPAMVNYPVIACAPTMVFFFCIGMAALVHNAAYRWGNQATRKTRSQIASRLRRWAHEHPLPENAEKPWLHDIELTKQLHPGPIGILFAHAGEFVGIPLLHSANAYTRITMPLIFLGTLMTVQFGFSTVVEYKSSTSCRIDIDFELGLDVVHFSASPSSVTAPHTSQAMFFAVPYVLIGACNPTVWLDCAVTVL